MGKSHNTTLRTFYSGFYAAVNKPMDIHRNSPFIILTRKDTQCRPVPKGKEDGLASFSPFSSCYCSQTFKVNHFPLLQSTTPTIAQCLKITQKVSLCNHKRAMSLKSASKVR